MSSLRGLLSGHDFVETLIDSLIEEDPQLFGLGVDDNPIPKRTRIRGKIRFSVDYKVTTWGELLLDL